MHQAEKLANQEARSHFYSLLSPQDARASVTVGLMLNSDVSDHRLNVEAIIRNINTISLELKKMKDMHHRRLYAAATAKGKGTAKTSVDQSELTAEAGEERTTTNEVRLCHQEEEEGGC